MVKSSIFFPYSNFVRRISYWIVCALFDSNENDCNDHILEYTNEKINPKLTQINPRHYKSKILVEGFFSP